MDSGTKLFIFRGESSSPFEKNKCVNVAKAIENVGNLSTGKISLASRTLDLKSEILG